VDYHFVSSSTFTKMAEAGAFLEYKEVHGEMYATPLDDMEAMLASGKLAILKIDVQGALEAIELRPEALSIFLLPPSERELEKRIRGRGTESDEVIQRRLQRAHAEIALSERYQYRLVNDSLDRAVDELVSLTR
jgi:guanylate kinase